MNFEFATAQRIIFGSGQIAQLADLAGTLGHRPALVTGGSAERIAPVFKQLMKAGLKPVALSITKEPTVERIEQLSTIARDAECDLVIALGGGSVIDAGKAIAALLTNKKTLMDYLEVIGKGEALSKKPAPCIAIPTTAGTGAEVTRNAVLLSTEHNVKVSIRHPLMLPEIALIDPELTLTLPPQITASTGLDAFVQLLESFVSIKSTPLTDAICREGLKKAAHALPRVCHNGDNLSLREEMCLASLFGGMALANAGLGAVHGFAGPLGGMFNAPHGIVCGCLLPAAMRINIQALQERDASSIALQKFNEIAQMVTHTPEAKASDALDWVKSLCRDLKTPGLIDMGVTEKDIPIIVQKAQNASSMKGNPLPLTKKELEIILSDSMLPSHHTL